MSIYGSISLQQIAAESYVDQLLDGTQPLSLILQDGSNDIRKVATDQFKGFTRMTVEQSANFVQRFQIIDHTPNHASGFSATLLLDTHHEYTLSFRSLEYRYRSQGGDFERDAQGASMELYKNGFALAQLGSMEQYWAKLTGQPQDGDSDQLTAFKTFIAGSNAQLNVSGYSLGGHLATVFTELHRAKVKHAYSLAALVAARCPVTPRKYRTSVLESR